VHAQVDRQQHPNIIIFMLQLLVSSMSVVDMVWFGHSW